MAALDQTMTLAGPNDRLVPGHGSILRRTDIVPHRDMILDIRAKVRQRVNPGKSEQRRRN